MFFPFSLLLEAKKEREDDDENDEQDRRRNGRRQKLCRQISTRKVTSRDEIFVLRKLQKRRKVDVVVVVDNDVLSRRFTGRFKISIRAVKAHLGDKQSAVESALDSTFSFY